MAAGRAFFNPTNILIAFSLRANVREARKFLIANQAQPMLVAAAMAALNFDEFDALVELLIDPIDALPSVERSQDVLDETVVLPDRHNPRSVFVFFELPFFDISSHCSTF